MLVSKGNAKLGPNVFHTNLTPGPDGSCPGATTWCEAHCYAQRGFYTFRSNVDKYAEQTLLLLEQPDAYEAMLRLEVAKLKPGAVFRFHTAGDVASVGHVGIIARIAASRPDVSFYLYTRSHRVADIRAAIERELFALPNVHVWGSTDETTGRVPDGWREARVFDSADEARGGGFGTVCPEQTGRKASCSDCGLCWNAKPEARLAFVTH